jgi:hypothetical protein
MTDLRELRERIGKLTGPDREVDQDLYCDLGLASKDADGILLAYHAPQYTASLDAALALVERVLPGFKADLDLGASWADNGTRGCRLWVPGAEPEWRNHEAEHVLPQCALLLAMIAALSSSPTPGGEDNG